jgi:hypothetical protein
MRHVEIDLAEPFEKILATVRSLPVGWSYGVRDRLTNEEGLEQVVRVLYEAANGRHVETKVGFIPIAPPVFDSLKAKPFRVGTQTDFLIEAAARLIARSVTAGLRDQIAEDLVDDKSGCEASIHYRPTHRLRISPVLHAR